MAQCFCGCGIEVGGFKNPRKAANTLGRRARRTKERLETLKPEIVALCEETGKDPNKVLKITDGHLSGCRRTEATCRAVVHEELAPREVDWPANRQVQKKAESMVSFFQPALEDQRRKGAAS